MCVISCAGGGSVRFVARRRSFLSRPHEHLLKAASAHAAIAGGEPQTIDAGSEPDGPVEPSAHSKAARRQRRNQGGKFA